MLERVQQKGSTFVKGCLSSARKQREEILSEPRTVWSATNCLPCRARLHTRARAVSAVSVGSAGSTQSTNHLEEESRQYIKMTV